MSKPGTGISRLLAQQKRRDITEAASERREEQKPNVLRPPITRIPTPTPVLPKAETRIKISANTTIAPRAEDLALAKAREFLFSGMPKKA